MSFAKSRRGNPGAVALALASTVCLSSAASSARVIVQQRGAERASAEPEDTSLRWRSSLEPLADALSGDAEQRADALERLSEIGSRAAVRAITRWLEQVELDERSWWQVCRALAPHARDSEARKWLTRLFSGALVQGEDVQRSALSDLTRATAATALTRSGHRVAVASVARALGQDERSSELAIAALLAHPPKDLTPVLKASGSGSLELIAALEALGDQRAFHPLRELVRTGTTEVQARAALALWRMGHLETVELAKYWAENARTQPELMRAATEILVATEAAGASTAFEVLLDLDANLALEVASAWPRSRLSKPLLSRLDSFSSEQQPKLASILAATGTTAAMKVLASWLTRPDRAGQAALALARSPHPNATDLLYEAAKQGKTRLPAIRALVVRAWLRDEDDSRLEQTLEELSRSSNDAERYVGAWGLSAGSAERANDYLISKDSVVVAAASSTLLVQPTSTLLVASRRLDRERRLSLSAALSNSLVDREAASAVHSSALHRLLLRRPALGLLTAATLTSRVEQRYPSRIADLLNASDITLRAAALRGLGSHPETAALGQLRTAYETSTEPLVRLAAIEALGQRQASVARNRVLKWAREFDPSAKIRSAARISLASGKARAQERTMLGHQAVWLDLPAHAPGDLVLLTDTDGHCVAALVPPDRRLVVLGFSDSRFDVRSVRLTDRRPQTHGASKTNTEKTAPPDETSDQ